MVHIRVNIWSNKVILSKCRQSFYSLRDSGMSYPGADIRIKKHLWKIMFPHTLVWHGMRSIAKLYIVSTGNS